MAVSGDATVGEVVQLMRAQRGSCVLDLRTTTAKLVDGIFTERDALRWMAEGGSPQTNIRERDDRRARRRSTPRRSVGAAIEMMAEGGYRHLPIVDEQGVPTGVAAVRGIVHYLVDHFPANHLHAAAGAGQEAQRTRRRLTPMA